jgi:hypothetical protein
MQMILKRRQSLRSEVEISQEYYLFQINSGMVLFSTNIFDSFKL